MQINSLSIISAESATVWKHTPAAAAWRFLIAIRHCVMIPPPLPATNFPYRCGIRTPGSQRGPDDNYILPAMVIPLQRP